MTSIEKQEAQSGLLLSKADKGRYVNINSTETLIQYIGRENIGSESDLICRGVLGATEFADIDIIVRQFQCVHLLHTRKGNFGVISTTEYTLFQQRRKKTLSNTLSL